MNHVAIGKCVGETLEHHHTAPFSANESVGMRIEGLAASVRGKESPFRQSDTHRGREHQCHPASQRNARLAGPQTLAREVQSYQRGRACCINRHTGAAQVQHVRQAVGENAVGCSSPGICVDRIEHAILLKRIVIVIAGYKHADPLACQTPPVPSRHRRMLRARLPGTSAAAGRG